MMLGMEIIPDRNGRQNDFLQSSNGTKDMEILIEDMERLES